MTDAPIPPPPRRPEPPLGAYPPQAGPPPAQPPPAQAPSATPADNSARAAILAVRDEVAGPVRVGCPIPPS